MVKPQVGSGEGLGLSVISGVGDGVVMIGDNRLANEVVQISVLVLLPESRVGVGIDIFVIVSGGGVVSIESRSL